MLIPDLSPSYVGGIGHEDHYQEIEYEIKKSRFIARLYAVSNKEQAKIFVEQSREAYLDARHHCWAYVVAQGSSASMSDDGEPSGTAGKPILNVLQHKNISEALIVVSRYFGGVKLGAGGLVRAYGKAAQMVVEAANLVEPVAMVNYKMEFGFSDEQMVRHFLEQIGGEILNLAYQNQVHCEVMIPKDMSARFVEKLQTHSIKHCDQIIEQ